MRYLLALIFLLILSACDAASTSQPTAVVIARPLATVFISPTPNAAQREATRFASTPTPTPPTPTALPSATAYIGIFIGEAQPDSVFVSDPSLFQNATSSAPIVSLAECETVIDEAYAVIWQFNGAVNERMGCPIQIAFGFFGRVQVFENGVMYRREDTDEVWAILPDANTVGQYNYVEAPESLSTEGMVAPEGLIVPEGSFGSVWSSVQDLRQTMGFALTSSQRIEMGMQRFDGGTFLLDATTGQIFALGVDGSAYGPFGE